MDFDHDSLAGHLPGKRIQLLKCSVVRGKPTSYLFRNNRDMTFTDVTEKAGVTASGWGQGSCVGDYDNDGFDDLFVSYWGRNVLYRNNSNGTFADVSRKGRRGRIGRAVGSWLLLSRLRSRWQTGSVRGELRELRPATCPSPG